MRLRNEQTTVYRERCYTCYRPEVSCFCHAIPQITNRTHLVILQHVKERFHAFNSARIVRHALRNSSLVVDRTANLAQRSFPLKKNVGLLYPDDSARLLNDVPQRDLPRQLVLLDGTWHHAKTFMKQIPWLSKLPKFRIAPDSPSTYRIRREPTHESLSTLEATVAALRIIEPETSGLDKLLQTFNVMVEGQLAHPRETGRQRLRARSGRAFANVPGVLRGDLKNIVVVYGEAVRGQKGIRRRDRLPVYWVAQRLESEEVFESAIRQEQPPSDDFLRLLNLTGDFFQHAPDTDTFCQKWKRFARDTDHIVAYRESTLHLLRATGVRDFRGLSLRGINAGQAGNNLDDVIRQFGLCVPSPRHRGRAGVRLANAVTFVRHLNATAQKSTV